ncbi:phosphoenolpyruvate--protein phosphotransferase [Aliivibrio sp. S2TY2]|uniref:phosphoenolpyruvate--protein phosphotransferase n=1 Tax=unclassified Aliivibrio TaxID=2645654 RepID=UPI002378ADB9|nr:MULTISPECIES: phosphoenolpyruvate--protein phosphotransferase [unclassified Aliivibrio]MDD9175456.1 phosphoenolpyruvate--protein phosphotransferase [Aliivibrio sp. S3TY1]MDD9192535.1 phosphoenolpyruvate--protein phosphotransferase [Aliivibrio sp. S2TY2]
MLTQLRDIVDHVAKAESLDDALALLVKNTRHSMRTECCSVYLMSNDNLRLELMATEGLKAKPNTVSLGIDEGLVGLVARSCEPLNLANASVHPSYKYIPSIAEYKFNSFLATPIIYRRQNLGVLVVQQKEKRQFTEVEESFLVTLSAQLAVVLAHAKAHESWSAHLQTSVIQQKQFKGISASNGVGIAPLWFDDAQPKIEAILPSSCLDIELEKDRLGTAVELALKDFRRSKKRFEQELNNETLAIFDLFTHLLNDPMLKADLKKQIDKGDSAEWALRQVIESYAGRFERMSDSYLSERANDVRELGQRLLYFLNYEDNLDIELSHPVILVTNQLTASMLASIPKDKLRGVISLEGAANSHAAILSRALGIPAIMGVEFNPAHYHKSLAIVDGYSGLLYIKPTEALTQEYIELQNEEIALSELITQDLDKPTLTLDGHLMKIHLNAGLSADSSIAVNQGVDGVGLYRTEIPFLLHQRFPSEEEQYLQYKAILETYPQKPVIMRTLDIGGDKPLPYLPIEEDNPFLGWRGIRFTLDHPDIFLLQLKAMVRANIGNENLSIMLPMISGIPELKQARVLINQAYEEVLSESDESFSKPRIGMMVEVPSMLYLLPRVAGLVDFISVGTNDLTQYLLAVDRNNSRVSHVYESYHPAVLLALKQIIDTANQCRLPVSVCGELAGDSIGCLLLMGLGYNSLSMNTSNVAKVKYIIRQVGLSEIETLIAKLLHHDDAEQILADMMAFFEEKNLSGFIRAGK